VPIDLSLDFLITCSTMHPHARVYSSPCRPFDTARRATDPSAESGTPSPHYAAPPLRIPRRRAEHRAREEPPAAAAPSNTSATRHQAHNYSNMAGPTTSTVIPRKPVGSGASTASSSRSSAASHTRAGAGHSRRRRPAAIVLSDMDGDALLGALLPETGQTLSTTDVESVLSSSSWSRVVEAASMDSDTAIDAPNATLESSVVVSSSATIRSRETVRSGETVEAGGQVPSGVRDGLDGAVAEAVDGRLDEETSAMTAELASLIVRTATKENLAWTRELGLWSIKMLVALYLATCLWSVVTTLVDAIVRLIAPVLTFGGFLLWMLGA
jgi:hypothetical protein